MDNNLIKIDDLVKQRLADGEEKERAGAWSNMKALLDEQMPQKAPVPMFGWRRTMLAVAGLVLVAAISVGGYELMNSFRADEPKENDLVTNAPANSAANEATSNVSNNDIKTTEKTSSGAVVNTPGDNNREQHNNKSGNKAVLKPVNGNLKVAVATGNTAKKTNSRPEPSNGSKASANTPSSGTSVAHNNEPNKLNNNKLSDNNSPNGLNNNKPAGIGNQQPGAGKNNTAANDAPANTNNSGNTAANENNKKPQPPAAPENKKKNNDNLADNQPARNDNMNPDNNRKEKQFKDSINMIATKEKYSVKEGWKRDTVEKAKVARFDVSPVDPANAMPITNPVPAGAIAANEEELVRMEPLEKNKVSTRKTGNSFGNASTRFEEMVKNTKFNMSRVTFHSGIMGGVNSSLATSNNTFGFQVGMFGAANISEHVTVFGEIKYMQRFGGSNSVYDNYNNNKQVTPSSKPGYVMHSWDSVDHSFKYPTLSSLRMPIAVRYAFKRFSMFCGGDFGYNFGVNTEEISQPNGTRVFQETPVNAEGLRFDENKTKPGITTANFGPRMEIGGMIGMSYSLTPATMIDLRVVQSMWSNAKTAGELKVFEDLYNNPSVQFNISYRFSNNKFKAYRRQ